MSDILDLLKQGAITGAQYKILEDAQRRAGDVPQAVMGGLETVTGLAQPYTEFKPFTVTTGTGATTTVGPQGLTMGLSDSQQQLVDQLQQQAATQAGMLGQVTPEQLMSQMQALRQPEQERAQLGLENRLAAQGRLGVETAAYGGTPEQLAMQKAIQEQQSADALAAIQGARNLRQQDLQAIEGMLGISGIPQQQALAAVSPAMQAQQIGAGLGQTQANLIGQLGKQYLAETGQAAQTQAQLAQQQSMNLMQNLLGPTGGGSASGSSGDGSFSSSLFGGLLDWATGLFGNNEYGVNTGLTDTSNYYDPNWNYQGSGFGDSGFGGTGGI